MTEEMNQQKTQTEDTTQSTDIDQSLEDFQENNQEDFEGSSPPAAEKKGMKPEHITALIAQISSQALPEKYRNQYQMFYIQTTTPILELVDFEDLTKGASVKDLPPQVRWILAGIGLAAPAIGGLAMFKKNIEKENKKDNDQGVSEETKKEILQQEKERRGDHGN